MIGKLFRLFAALFVYFCVGTVMALGVGAGYLWFSGSVNADKLVQIAAVVQGVDLLAVREKVESEREKINPTQVSIEDVARQRALASFDLDLREQALEDARQRARLEQTQLDEELVRYNRDRTAFLTELNSMREGAIAENQSNARVLVENLKPKQAKEQLMLMIKAGQIDEVVTLVKGMPVTRQAKIATEFKTAEEQDELAKILDLIREGVPETPLIDQTQRDLTGAGEPPAPTQ